MKKGIHPESRMVKFVCSSGYVLETLSTIKQEEVRIEISSNNHPFYTGEQRILKTGAVDKFYARMNKTKSLQK
jgi:large subunit ribosomal protein L31